MEEQEKERRTMWFRATLVPEKGGGYSAYCPGLPGVFSGGETQEKALSNLAEAASLHLEALAEAGLGIPEKGDVTEVLQRLLCNAQRVTQQSARLLDGLEYFLPLALLSKRRVALNMAQTMVQQAADVFARAETSGQVALVPATLLREMNRSILASCWSTMRLGLAIIRVLVMATSRVLFLSLLHRIASWLPSAVNNARYSAIAVPR
jgi:predicted RNase H-like HicB family nuclease